MNVVAEISTTCLGVGTIAGSLADKIDIALQSGKFGPLDSTFLKQLGKDIFRKIFPIPFGHGEQIWMGLKQGFTMGLAKSIPGTNILTYIAAKNPIVKLASHL